MSVQVFERHGRSNEEIDSFRVGGPWLIDLKGSHEGVVGFSQKTGVSFQQIKSPSDFVGYALTGAVIAAEQFEVLNPVIGSITVNMVDGLPGKKLAPDFLFHAPTVLQNFDGFLVGVASDGDSQVPVTRSTRDDLSISVGSEHLFAVEFLPAFGAANFSAPVQIETVLPRNRGHRTPTIFAQTRAFIARVFSPTDASAFTRAVKRVFAPLVSVGAQLAGVLLEKRAALFAVKTDRCDLHLTCVPSVSVQEHNLQIAHLLSTEIVGAV